MRVTIWDLDYYYSSTKVDCFNPDVMKISSYHKQLGDQVNFVLKEDDIYRPYDLYYIIKLVNKQSNIFAQYDNIMKKIYVTHNDTGDVNEIDIRKYKVIN